MIKIIKIFILCISIPVLVSACTEQPKKVIDESPQFKQNFFWKMVTSWPKNFPGLGVAPEQFATQVEAMSGGRLTIKVYGAGELVPGFEVFDSVASGAVEMGHSGAYYWQGKMPAAPFFTAVPFGMNAQETNAWLHYGGGLELWQELYKPFGIIPVAGGNSGVQFAGWFNKEINSLEDLEGLRMRIGGIGGDVFNRVGGMAIQIPGGEIFTALQGGLIDASEWVGPYNDLAFGFYKTSKYYYSSAWQEPSATLEFLINEQAFNELPADLQQIVLVAARAVNDDMLSKYTARNSAALKTLINDHGVEVRTFPEPVMQAFKAESTKVINAMVERDSASAKIWASYKKFYDEVRAYHEITEKAYMQNR